MNALTWTLLALTVVVGAVDWFAVHTERKPLEYVAKPATMLPLIGAALALDPAVPAMRPWFVAALVCSLAGDVFLMLPKPEQFFVPGLASFLVGHVLFTLPFIVLTMGLGIWMINAVLFYFVGRLVDGFLGMSVGAGELVADLDGTAGLPADMARLERCLRALKSDAAKPRSRG